MPELDPASVLKAIADDQRLQAFVGHSSIAIMPARQTRRRLLLDADEAQF